VSLSAFSDLDEFVVGDELLTAWKNML